MQDERFVRAEIQVALGNRHEAQRVRRSAYSNQADLLTERVHLLPNEAAVADVKITQLNPMLTVIDMQDPSWDDD
eukprot:9480265-Pyramimonas_sp.AAC.1